MHLDWYDRVPPGGDRAISTSLTDDEARQLAKYAMGKKVLEIGSAYGFSTVTMALAGATHVTAVDPHSWCQPPTLPVIEENVRPYGDHVRLIVDTFFNACETLKDERFDFIFIDGDHSYDTVKFDFIHAGHLLKPEGTLACHDYGECCCPGVPQALDELRPDGPNVLTDTLAVYSWLRSHP